jgi:MOSC domain-containing protein YiiM
VNVGRVEHRTTDGKSWTTGIYKTPAEGPRYAAVDGFEDDQQADRVHHGGPDKALCCYSVEHYAALGSRIGRAVTFGVVGENLSMAGLTEEAVCIGDAFEVGEAVVQISQPREPCWKLARKLEDPNLVKWVREHGCTGYYVRVLRPGNIRTGDEVVHVDRSVDAITVALACRLMFDADANAAAIRRLASQDALSATWKAALTEKLSKLAP